MARVSYRSLRASLSYRIATLEETRHCSFSTSLCSTRRSPSSTQQDELWKPCICCRRADVLEQTSSRNPCKRLTTEFQVSAQDILFLTLITSSAGALKLDSMLWRLRSQRVIIIIIIIIINPARSSSDNIPS